MTIDFQKTSLPNNALSCIIIHLVPICVTNLYGHSVKEDHPKILTPHALNPVPTFVSSKANCSEKVHLVRMTGNFKFLHFDLNKSSIPFHGTVIFNGELLSPIFQRCFFSFPTTSPRENRSGI